MSLQASSSSSSWHKHKRVIFVCGVMVAGGYVSYSIYKSHFVSRKAKQVAEFLRNLSVVLRVLVDASDSVSLLSADLKGFLLSEEDEIPRSIRQACKIMASPEFLEGFVGLLQGFNQGFASTSQICKKEMIFNDISVRNIPVTDVFIEKTKDTGSSSANATIDRNRLKGCLLDRKLWDRGQDKPFRGLGDMQGGLLERLVDKFFSEPGKGFASTIIGCVARNIVLSGYEVCQRLKKANIEKASARDGSEWELRTLSPDVCVLQQEQVGNAFKGKRVCDKFMKRENVGQGSTSLERVLDFAAGSKGKALIAECIKVFVGTAVSVYLDKTKDVNFYEDLVAGLTKPSHQAPVTEVLGSVCSGAVETLVRTSHEVLSRRPGSENNLLGSRSTELRNRKTSLETTEKSSLQVAQSSDGIEKDIPTRIDHQKDHSESRGTNLLNKSVNSILKPENIPHRTSFLNPCGGYEIEIENRSQTHLQSGTRVTTHNGASSDGPSSLMNGLSRTLAVPSNRKLVIDVAGAMASEAVKSFFQEMWLVFKPVFGVAEAQGHTGMAILDLNKVRYIANILMANALVLLTLWVAIIMHVTSGFLGMG